MVRKIFEVGSRYEVLQDFTLGPSTFERGEVLIFELDGKVPYDDGDAYQFRSEFGGITKTWLLFSFRPVETWKEFFQDAH